MGEPESAALIDIQVVRLLEALERSLQQPSVRGSARLGDLLAEDFVEVGASGRSYNRQEVIAMLHQESAVRIDISDLQVRRLGDDVALVTYRACKRDDLPRHSLRSSIWRQSQHRWRLVFHQGTLCPDAS